MAVTVRQKKRGRGNPWWVFVHKDGIIRSKQVGDRKAAEDVASAIRQKLKAGEFIMDAGGQPEDEAPRVGEYLEYYLSTYVKTTLKHSTQCGYRFIADNHLLPEWADRRLNEVTRGDVKGLLLRKRQTLAYGSVINIRNVISGMFRHAIDEEIITHNPAQRMGRVLRRDGDRRECIRPLTRDQVRDFLDTAATHYPRYHALLMCAFRTGMRMGELLALAWSDIDFSNHTIRVRRSFSKDVFSTPKSRWERTVDMSDQLSRTLAQHRTALIRRFCGSLPTIDAPVGREKTSLIQLVFPSEQGTPLHGDNLRHRTFYSICKRLDLTRFRFHDIRHTFASLLLTQGESLHYVKEQMGHASIQTTVDTYGHMVPGTNRQAVNSLDDPDRPALAIATAGA